MTPRTLLSSLYRLIGGAMFALLLVTAAQAQPASGSRLADRLGKDLNLSAQQTEQLRNALGNQNATSRQPGYLWSVARTLQQTLTPAQRQALIERAPARGQRQGGRAGARFDRRGRFAQSAWRGADLSQEQRERLSALRQKYAQERQSLGRGAQADTSARRALRQRFMNEARSVLTPQQQARIDSLRQRRQSLRTQGEQQRNSALQLTPEQQRRLESLRAERRQQQRNLRTERQRAADSVLTPEQRELLQIHNALQGYARGEQRPMHRRPGRRM